MNLANNLKRIRKENNLSQEQFADKLGVSRQAVSKWESAVAIPEMEKLIAICKMFNLNMDELLNQDVRMVNDSKQTRNNVNKYIDDFLMFITKTIDMFSSMSFKSKIKCLFEQGVIIGVMAIILSIVGSVFLMFVQDFLGLLPDNVYYVIYNIISDIYFVFCFILCVVLIVHIFKVRYLDYYVIVRDGEMHDDEGIEENIVSDDIDGKNRVYLEKKREKIIIRDPENASYKFINFVLKGLLLVIKSFVLSVAFWFCCSLIFFSFLLVMSFLFVKVGLAFVGTLIMIMSAIAINIVILNIFYNFIVSKKLCKNILAIVFIVSLITFGVGSGILGIGITEFRVSDYDNHVKSEKVIAWNDNLSFCDYYDIEYIVSDNKDVRIVYDHSLYYDVNVISDNNVVWFNVYSSYDDIMKVVRSYIKDINNKNIVDYSDISIKVYTSSENIERIKKNNLE